MASILQNLLGGGLPPESLGRRPTAVGDRDVASRDTVYRKPAAKADTTSSTKKPAAGGGGGKKAGGGGGARIPIPTPRPSDLLPETAPIPTANPMAPSPLPPQHQSMPALPPMPPALNGVPPDLMGPPTGPGGTPLDAGNMRGRPDPMMPPAPGPGTGSVFNFAAGPTTVPGPGRAELAALLRPGQQPQPQQQGSLTDAMKMDLNYKTPNYHLPWWLGGTGG